jgi:hypothetical protein
MATKIYESGTIELLDGTILTISPLKILYLRELLEEFENVKVATEEDVAIYHLSVCAAIAMKQYMPELSVVEELEENIDITNIYNLLDYATGIKIVRASEAEDQSVIDQAKESGATWDDLDLAKLESEVFLLGIWKDYHELESSLSMPELTATITAKRDFDSEDRKFQAAIQGIDLDKQSGNKESNPWEAMKARVFSGGAAANENDILAYQGVNAQKAGFGIGMGIEYEKE